MKYIENLSSRPKNVNWETFASARFHKIKPFWSFFLASLWIHEVLLVSLRDHVPLIILHLLEFHKPYLAKTIILRKTPINIASALLIQTHTNLYPYFITAIKHGYRCFISYVKQSLNAGGLSKTGTLKSLVQNCL